MIKSPNYMTPQGLKSIRTELLNLLDKERPELVKTVAWAASNGDRSENADYIYGKRRLREIDSRIHFLQTRLDNIEVINPATVKSDRVNFGATVTIKDEDGKQSTYQIVGEDEINLELSHISWQSPLAKALMGKKEDETTIVKRPKGDMEITIIKIEYK